MQAVISKVVGINRAYDESIDHRGKVVYELCKDIWEISLENGDTISCSSQQLHTALKKSFLNEIIQDIQTIAVKN